jgi:hypothetical protein
MQDMKARLEKLIADAAECDLIASRAAEQGKCQAFRDLAAQYRKMADAIRQTMSDRQNC